MAAGAVSSARDPRHDVRWRWLLLALCALGAVLIIADVADWVGVGGRPWAGLWQALTVADDSAYVGAFTQVVPGGASDKAGLRDGDRIDLREQNFDARVRFSVGDPMASRPSTVRAHRGARQFPATVLGGTVFSDSSGTAKINFLLFWLSQAWFLGCATLVAAHRWWRYEARMLALVMLCVVGDFLGNQNNVVPSAGLQVLLCTVAITLLFLEAILLVALSSRYGKRATWRGPLEWFAYAANAVLFLTAIAAIVGLTTLWFDPMPYLSISEGFLSGGNAVLVTVMSAVPWLAVASCALAAVVTSSPPERTRAAWLLLPLPFAIAGGNIISGLGTLAPSYSLFYTLLLTSNVCNVLGAFIVSYALLKRRILDFGFVLNRAVVVSIVGLVVVVAFVLLEWMLGSVLTGVSHATGLIANAALALVIGVSLNYIHQRVDRSVDLVLFRKRHENEQSLLAFSKEAAYVTEWDALLDATLEKVRRHTDARSAAILVGANGFYSAIRSFGDNTVAPVNENDEAILALKVWHKPVDPHHYDTALHAALALPMLSRGKLYGVLILGERTGGEAYAPDEVEALSQLANGVGSALEALSMTADGPATALADYVAGLHHAIVSMNESITAEIRALRTSSLT